MIGSVCLANTVESKAQLVSSSDCEISVFDENGDRLPGVSIHEQGSSSDPVFTDWNGEATLSCSETATIILTCEGYLTSSTSREEGQKEITIVMIPE